MASPSDTIVITDDEELPSLEPGSSRPRRAPRRDYSYREFEDMIVEAVDNETETTQSHQELRILQYNVQKSRDVVLASLFQNPRVLEYDVLAIQEPWRNPFIATSYHPLKEHFQLLYSPDAVTRVCLYVNKRVDPGTLSVSFISKDIISLKISDSSTNQDIHIFNVYNEVTTDTLPTLAEAIGTLSSDKIVVLGASTTVGTRRSTRKRDAFIN